MLQAKNVVSYSDAGYPPRDNLVKTLAYARRKSDRSYRAGGRFVFLSNLRDYSYLCVTLCISIVSLSETSLVYSVHEVLNMRLACLE